MKQKLKNEEKLYRKVNDVREELTFIKVYV